jgi:hypothetical protein
MMKDLRFALVSFVFLLLPMTSQAELYSNYNHGQSYGAFVTGMPDLDQRRDTPVWSDETDEERDGGRMYCGPTSGANVISYLAQAGYDDIGYSAVDLEPVDTYGMSGGELFATNFSNGLKRMFADQLIEDTADAMGTHLENGTGAADLRDGLRAMLPDDFEVKWYGNKECRKRSATIINPRRLFDELDDGHLVIMRYGYYNTDVETGHTERNGGHWVVLTGVTRHYETRRVWYRDPARDYGVSLSDAPETQSEFVSDSYYVAKSNVTEDTAGCTRTRWELLGLRTEDDIQVSQKYIEDIVVVIPPGT